ncbi:hypothetical protein ONZ45_g7832 [Pleurotus djamor]|nr:hypothetical protein ONZ45_g7832 [Pleurotus djamor]
MLFLTSSSSLKPSHNLDALAARALNTYTLGEHIGSQWGLGRHLRWTPTVSHEKLGQLATPSVAKSAGLYKVQGDTVAAILGSIFFQFGAAEAHRVFHTRVLPHLFLNSRTQGLPDAFRRDALAISQQLQQQTA